MLQIQSLVQHDPQFQSAAEGNAKKMGDGFFYPHELEALLCAVAERACRPSFNRLYDITISRMFGIVHRIVRDPEEVQDVIQEIYVKVWHSCGKFDQTIGQAQPWLSRIAHNHAVSSLRRRSTRPRPLRSSPDDGDPYEGIASQSSGPEDLLIHSQRRQAVRVCLKALPSLARETLALSFYDGLSHIEIAEQLGRPLGTVKSCIRRALSGIGPALEAHR